MSFTQLTQTLPVFVIGKGKGTAIAVIDYGPEANLIWVTALDETGELWCAPNPLVRMRANWTLGRPVPAAELKAGAELDGAGAADPGCTGRAVNDETAGFPLGPVAA